MEGHTSGISGAEVLSDGRLLSWSYLDRTLRLWDYNSGKPLAILKGHNSFIGGVKVLPDGRILSWDNGTLRLWDGESGKPLALFEGPHALRIKSTEVLSNDRLLLLSCRSEMILWDINTFRLIQVYQFPLIENAAYPSAWEDFEKIANAQRFNDVWIESADRFISLANRQKGWIARWHHDANKARIAGVSGSSYVLSSGRQMIFLELMYGRFPLVNKQMPLSEV